MTTRDAPEAALATLCHEPFFEPGWLYERKLDGERCLSVGDGSAVRLYSRSGRDVTVGFPEIAEALADQDAPDFVVDGEVVAFDGPRTSFARLQPRIHVNNSARARATGIAIFYYVFDVLRANGEDTRQLPLRERKGRLRDLFGFRDPLRYTNHRVRADKNYLADACERGWEGLIAKRADAPYPNRRSREWLKFKCEAGQELIIVGYTDPAGSRVGLGALLLGYFAGEDLAYAGKVGTGFSDRMLRDLEERLSALEIGKSPCTRGKLPSAGVHWVRPELVGEVSFAEWTSAGQLRHPRFLGLRRDKAARDVVRE
ncbi:MAG TPA: non-homologous end-joining DNA ligase [Nocardioidaceae bacterium]|nr:non-homologous end-joining DNA ligase [Nocardioidaceae bacterium]